MTLNTSQEKLPASGYSPNAGFWIRIIREQLDTYRTELTHSAILDALNPQPGETIVDAGCGEGWLSRASAQQGAQVVGVDLCPEFIEAARSASDGEVNAPTYKLGDVRNLPVAERFADAVVINHVLNDIPDPDAAIKEFARVLRDNGRLVILLLHPCFYTAQAERVEHAPPFRAGEYFGQRIVRQPFKIAGITSPAETVTYVYPLEFYFSALTDAGFAVTRLSEPHPSPELIEANPWWKDNFRRALFLLITAQLNGTPSWPGAR